jgi:hypothetical protein
MSQQFNGNRHLTTEFSFQWRQPIFFFFSSSSDSVDRLAAKQGFPDAIISKDNH